MRTFLEDKQNIENKYHKADEPFNAYQRFAYHGYDFDKTTGLPEEEIKKGLALLSKQNENLPRPIAKAKAMAYALENTMIDVNEHDYFVGFYSWGRIIQPFTQSKWSAEMFEKTIADVGHLISDMNDSGAVSIWADFDHVVPDWDSILSLGFKGLKDRAEKYHKMHIENGTLTDEMDAHFKAMDIEYAAILGIIDRLYLYASGQDHTKAEKIAECLKHIRDGVPTNIYEAMQVMYIYFMMSESFDLYQVRSLGNGLDSSLLPFYEKDIQNGTFTREEIKEYLAYFLFQWQAIGNYWGQPFYIGGTNQDGSTKYNDLSRDILDVYETTGIYNPKVQVKINTNTPDDIIEKILSMIRNGQSCFVFCCEPTMIKSIMSYGATYDEAREMDIRGCYATGIKGEVSTSVGYINDLKPIEYVFSNGFDKRINKQIGLKTGELSEFVTFEDFYIAVHKQWEYLIDMAISCGNVFEKYLSNINPSIMYSSTIEESLKKGLDAYQNGVKFNNSHILSAGFANLVDSIMVVKELVYDKKAVTLEELKNALDANWQGFEDLQRQALNCKHKYGNGDAEADLYAETLATFFASKINGVKNARGGIYKADIHSAMQFLWQGEKTDATPDGRFRYTEMSKNGSPAVGMDKNGVTALINSATALNPIQFWESFCVDVMLHSSATSGEDGLNAMKALLLTYMKNGGTAIQFNVFNAETLKDAQKNPDKYKNLQVRVCGWNVLWNNLSEKEQSAYIMRAENIQG